MAELFNFPDKGARDWRITEEVLRTTWGGTKFDGPPLEAALEKVRAQFESIFASLSFPLEAVLPEGSTAEQQQFARDVLDGVGQQVHAVVMRERHALFAALMSAELQLAYWLHYGKKA